MNKTTLVGAALVLLAFAGGRTFWSRAEAPAGLRPLEIQPAATLPTTTSNAPGYDALEVRLRQLELRATEPTSASAPSPSVPPAPLPELSPEGRRSLGLEKVSERKAQIASEADDPKWSRNAKQSFQKDFQAFSGRGKFAVKDLECKTTSCLATLTWPSYADAQKRWQGLLHAPYTKNCAREVLVPLPEPDQMSAPYDATVFFDCTEDRSQ